ncbi:C-type lectin galactose-binding isoform-like [Anoplopoma fimbria]|uniref:C-type lectin galactose-binding isoform-like n=1 Tax=Anoplopoma fimbria TaxID=229290 RepID=UPI0023EDEFFD|nr:C-type lectin galactose-binding isoform-like [Anoplopoma fimbria]
MDHRGEWIESDCGTQRSFVCHGENEAVHNLSLSQNVWIGLFKDSWKWSDGSKTSFRYWKPSQPNYLSGQNCAIEATGRQQWVGLPETEKLNFICYACTG